MIPQLLTRRAVVSLVHLFSLVMIVVVVHGRTAREAPTLIGESSLQTNSTSILAVNSASGAAQAPYTLKETLSQFPLEVGRFWKYDISEVYRQDFGETATITGQSTVTIVRVRDGRWEGWQKLKLKMW